MTAPRPKLTAPKGSKGKTGKPLPVAVRRARLLKAIDADREAMHDAAIRVLQPLYQLDRFRARARGERHWIYPAAPVLALLAWRFRPGLNSLSGLALRGWSLWRIWMRMRR